MVEWKKLGEVCKRNKGIPITAGQMSELAVPNGNVRVFAAGQTIADINGADLPINCAYKKPSIIVKSRGYIDFEFYEKPFTHKNEMWSYSFDNKEQGKYIFYYLTTKTELFRKKARANSVKLPQLCVADTDNFYIPLPSLSEQERIVGILDTFTSSIENLKAQISLRRKQYEHYRDKLLDLEGKPGVEMKTLGEIARVLRGKRLTKNLLSDDAQYPVFHGGLDPLGKYGQFNRDANTVMVINVGASAGTVGFCDCKFWSSDGCFCISHSELINNKFLFYYLQTKTHYLQSQVRHAGIPTLDNPVVEKIAFPMINLQEQSRIVSILDEFEASIKNLEAQLEAREKQYEYYRNKLLTFE